MAVAEYGRVHILVDVIDNASKQASKIVNRLRQKVSNISKVLGALTPNINTAKVQSGLDKLNMDRAKRNIFTGVDAAQRKIDSLTAGNAPNKISTPFQKAFQKVGKELDSFQKKLQDLANLTITAHGVEDFGKKVTSALASPIKAGMSFEAAMSKVSAVSLAKERKADIETGSKKVKKALAQLTAEARRLGATTAWSSSQIAEGMSFLGMSGMKWKDIIKSMKGMANLASSGNIDLARAADIASNIGTAMFGKKAASQMERLSDVMAHTITNFNVDISMLGETMKYAASSASMANVPLEVLATAAGVLGNSGVQASQAGTTLRKVLTRLAKSPKPAADALAKLGIVTTELVNGKQDLKDFPKLLKEIADKTKNLGTAERIGLMADIAGLTAVSGFSILVKSAETGDLQKAIDAMGEKGANVVGSATSVATELLNNLKGDVTILSSVTEALKITVYNTVKPILRTIIQGTTKIVGGINDWADKHQTLISILMKGGAVLASTALGAAIILKTFVGLSVTISVLRIGLMGLTPMFSPLMLLVGLGVAIHKYWQPVKSFFLGVWDGLVIGFAPVIPVINQALKIFVPIYDFFKNLVTPIQTTTGALLQFGNVGQLIGTTIGGVFPKLFQAGKALVTTFTGGIISAGKAVWDALLSVLNFVARLLPFSDAQSGPLSNLEKSGAAIPKTIAKGILSWKGIVFKALKESFSPMTLLSVLIFGIPMTALVIAAKFVYNLVSEFKKANPGQSLLKAFATGIKNAGKFLWNALFSVLKFVRNLLPFSDAKTGPLSTLSKSGEAIPKTIASGILAMGGAIWGALVKVFKVVQAPFFALVTGTLIVGTQQGGMIVLELIGKGILAGGKLLLSKVVLVFKTLFAPSVILGAAIVGLKTTAIVIAATLTHSLTSAFLSAKPGQAILTTLAIGIRNAGKFLWDALLSVLNFVARLLPFSDAKTGPLSNLTQRGYRFISTLVAGMIKGGGYLFSKLSSIFSTAIGNLTGLFSAFALGAIPAYFIQLVAQIRTSSIGTVFSKIFGKPLIIIGSIVGMLAFLSGGLTNLGTSIRNAFPSDLSAGMFAAFAGIYAAIEIGAALLARKIRKTIGGKLIKTAIGIGIRGLFTSTLAFGAAIFGAELLGGFLMTNLLYGLISSIGGFNFSAITVSLVSNIFAPIYNNIVGVVSRMIEGIANLWSRLWEKKVADKQPKLALKGPELELPMSPFDMLTDKLWQHLAQFRKDLYSFSIIKYPVDLISKGLEMTGLKASGQIFTEILGEALVVGKEAGLVFGGAIASGVKKVLALFGTDFWTFVTNIFSIIGVGAWEYFKVPFTALGELGSTLGLMTGVSAIVALFTKIEVAAGNTATKVYALKYAFQTKQLFSWSIWSEIRARFKAVMGKMLLIIVYPLERIFIAIKSFIFLPRLLNEVIKTSVVGKAPNLLAMGAALKAVYENFREIFSLKTNFSQVGKMFLPLIFVGKWVFGINRKLLITRNIIVITGLAVIWFWKEFTSGIWITGSLLSELGGHIGLLFTDLMKLPWGDIGRAIAITFKTALNWVISMANQIFIFREWLGEIFGLGWGSTIFATLAAVITAGFLFLKSRFKRFTATTMVTNTKTGQQVSRAKGKGLISNLRAFQHHTLSDTVSYKEGTTCKFLERCFEPTTTKVKKWWTPWKTTIKETASRLCGAFTKCTDKGAEQSEKTWKRSAYEATKRWGRATIQMGHDYRDEQKKMAKLSPYDKWLHKINKLGGATKQSIQLMKLYDMKATRGDITTANREIIRRNFAKWQSEYQKSTAKAEMHQTKRSMQRIGIVAEKARRRSETAKLGYSPWSDKKLQTQVQNEVRRKEEQAKKEQATQSTAENKKKQDKENAEKAAIKKQKKTDVAAARAAKEMRDADFDEFGRNLTNLNVQAQTCTISCAKLVGGPPGTGTQKTTVLPATIPKSAIPDRIKGHQPASSGILMPTTRPTTATEQHKKNQQQENAQRHSAKTTEKQAKENATSAADREKQAAKDKVDREKALADKVDAQKRKEFEALQRYNQEHAEQQKASLAKEKDWTNRNIPYPSGTPQPTPKPSGKVYPDKPPPTLMGRIFGGATPKQPPVPGATPKQPPVPGATPKKPSLMGKIFGRKTPPPTAAQKRQAVKEEKRAGYSEKKRHDVLTRQRTIAEARIINQKKTADKNAVVASERQQKKAQRRATLSTERLTKIHRKHQEMVGRIQAKKNTEFFKRQPTRKESVLGKLSNFISKTRKARAIANLIGKEGKAGPSTLTTPTLVGRTMTKQDKFKEKRRDKFEEKRRKQQTTATIKQRPPTMVQGPPRPIQGPPKPIQGPPKPIQGPPKPSPVVQGPPRGFIANWLFRSKQAKIQKKQALINQKIAREFEERQGVTPKPTPVPAPPAPQPTTFLGRTSKRFKDKKAEIAAKKAEIAAKKEEAFKWSQTKSVAQQKQDKANYLKNIFKKKKPTPDTAKPFTGTSAGLFAGTRKQAGLPPLGATARGKSVTQSLKAEKDFLKSLGTKKKKPNKLTAKQRIELKAQKSGHLDALQAQRAGLGHLSRRLSQASESVKYQTRQSSVPTGKTLKSDQTKRQMRRLERANKRQEREKQTAGKPAKSLSLKKRVYKKIGELKVRAKIMMYQMQEHLSHAFTSIWNDIKEKWNRVWTKVKEKWQKTATNFRTRGENAVLGATKTWSNLGFVKKTDEHKTATRLGQNPKYMKQYSDKRKARYQKYFERQGSRFYGVKPEHMAPKMKETVREGAGERSRKAYHAHAAKKGFFRPLNRFQNAITKVTDNLNKRATSISAKRHLQKQEAERKKLAEHFAKYDKKQNELTAEKQKKQDKLNAEKETEKRVEKQAKLDKETASRTMGMGTVPQKYGMAKGAVPVGSYRPTPKPIPPPPPQKAASTKALQELTRLGIGGKVSEKQSTPTIIRSANVPTAAKITDVSKKDKGTYQRDVKRGRGRSRKGRGSIKEIYRQEAAGINAAKEIQNRNLSQRLGIGRESGTELKRNTPVMHPTTTPKPLSPATQKGMEAIKERYKHPDMKNRSSDIWTSAAKEMQQDPSKQYPYKQSEAAQAASRRQLDIIKRQREMVAKKEQQTSKTEAWRQSTGYYQKEQRRREQDKLDRDRVTQTSRNIRKAERRERKGASYMADVQKRQAKMRKRLIIAETQAYRQERKRNMSITDSNAIQARLAKMQKRRIAIERQAYKQKRRESKGATYLAEGQKQLAIMQQRQINADRADYRQARREFLGKEYMATGQARLAKMRRSRYKQEMRESKGAAHLAAVQSRIAKMQSEREQRQPGSGSAFANVQSRVSKIQTGGGQPSGGRSAFRKPGALGLIMGAGGLAALSSGAQAAGTDTATHSVTLLGKALDKANAALTYFKENMATVTMTALMMGMMFMDPIVMLKGIAKAGLLAAAAFAGWELGTWLYKFEPIRETAIYIVGIFVETGAKIGAAIGGWWTANISPTLSQLPRFFSDAFSRIGETFSAEGITGLLAGVGEIIRTSLNNVWDGLGDVFAAPADLVTQLLVSISTATGELVASIQSGNWSDAGKAMMWSVINGIKIIGVNLGKVLIGVLKMGWSALVASLTMFVDIGTGIIKFIVKGLVGLGATLIKIASDAATGFGNALIDGIKNKVKALKNTVSETLKGLRDLLPFSDAKIGPLSDLTKAGASIPITLAKGVTSSQQVLKTALDGAFANAMAKRTFPVAPNNTLQPDLPETLPQIAEQELLYESDKGNVEQAATESKPSINFGDIIINISGSQGNPHDIAKLGEIVREQLEIIAGEQIRRAMYDYG